MKAILVIVTIAFVTHRVHAEDGYRLWLRYDKIKNHQLLHNYRNQISNVIFLDSSTTADVAKAELQKGLSGLLGQPVNSTGEIKNGSIIVAPATSPLIGKLIPRRIIDSLGTEGFYIRNAVVNNKKVILICARESAGLLYGTFHFLRLLQMNQPVDDLKITSVPAIKLRMLNHWDNLDRTVERGYAGFSIWNWHTLPDYIDQRYINYARANASVGINAVSITNVNANSMILSPAYLEKVKALADLFRPYHIKIFLTARFSSPMELGKLGTADPLDSSVRSWWKEKAKELYQYIPDFGGFLVKANSEGQPGPQDYHRTHADGANMLANALQPFGGIVIWRAFVYSSDEKKDRFKQAYEEFKPLDGQFRENVLLQVKNGPIDFQPREPFSPLFGAMPHTPLMMEFQITQEYLGQGTHLVYEVPLFKEVLDADTYAKGEGSFVAKVVNGSLDHHALNGMAGVSNIGSDINWTGHLFGQANWYGYARIAWDHNLSPEDIAEEWIRQTFGNEQKLVKTVTHIMLESREAVVNYMTPLGLHHIMGTGHHYGPAPWDNHAQRTDWNPIYFHRADSVGIGFDRTASGSNALAQYQPPVAKKFASLKDCPDKYLLWFHHVPWNYIMRSGNTLWADLCAHYNEGVEQVKDMQASWQSLKSLVDAQRFHHVEMMLNIQEKDAAWWRDVCLLYFRQFSKMPVPGEFQPAHSLEYYMTLKFPYAPGRG